MPAVDADFYFPDLSISIKGQLYIEEPFSYFILPENPYGRYEWRPISIAHVTTSRRNYTCVESILYRSADNMWFYKVTELYENGHLGEASIPEITCITAEHSFLTEWLMPRLVDIAIGNDGNNLMKVNIDKNKSWKYKIGENLTLAFESYITTNHTPHQFKAMEKSTVRLRSFHPVARNEIFANYYTFLNVFMLFLHKTPETTRLSFTKNDLEVKLLGLPHPIEGSTFDVLLCHNEVTDMQALIDKYYKNAYAFNEIVSLWQSGLEQLSPEVKFLHLTQGLELFHRTFLENDKSVETWYISLVNTLYGRKTKNWIQIMRYLHLIEIFNSLDTKTELPATFDIFAERLTRSRNFYTHYGSPSDVYGYFDLYQINSFIHGWLRSLILHQLGLDSSAIYKIQMRAKRQTIDTNILGNKYSMRFSNRFTLR